jgi:hypothetical protein
MNGSLLRPSRFFVPATNAAIQQWLAPHIPTICRGPRDYDLLPVKLGASSATECAIGLFVFQLEAADCTFAGVTYMNKVTRQHGRWTATGTISTPLPQAPPYISYATAKCDRPKECVGCAFLVGHASRWRRVRTVQGLRCNDRRPFCFPECD